MINSVLISRLIRHYDPFQVLFSKRLKRLGRREFEVAPLDFAPNELRTGPYHARRIAYFMDAIHEGKSLDPIEVDNHWIGYTPCEPIVVDGHHRLCAAILVGLRRIDCEYSGAVNTLRWLEGRGRADRPPFD